MELLLMLTAVSLTTAASITVEDMQWHAWKKEFGKSYSSVEEGAHRMEVWLSNLKTVLMHNLRADQGLTTYRMEVNAYADLSNEEYRKLIVGNCLRKDNDTISTPLMLKDVSLPAEVDWRKSGYVTPVKDQKQCGSCWAFSATGALEGQHFRATGKLVSLSEQQLVDCSHGYGNDGCHGGLMDQAFHYIRDNGGIDTEGSYPYQAQDGSCRFNPGTIGATCSGYVSVWPQHEFVLQYAVAKYGPVSVAIDASQRSFQLYSSGIYDDPYCINDKLNHAVLVVGYGTMNGVEYWLVKNSWGTHWGVNGYAYMSRNKNNQCGIASDASLPQI
ncbi:cathepsin L.1 isoform X1 [Rhinoraja longicauda]